MIRFFSLFFFGCPVFFLECFAPVWGEQAEPERGRPGFSSVVVGIDGFYKNGCWTPITVYWVNEKGKEIPEKTRVSLTCSDSDGAPITYSTDVTEKNTTKIKLETELPEDLYKTLFYAKLGRNNGSIRIMMNSPAFEIGMNFTPGGDPMKLRDTFPLHAFNCRFCEPISSERPIYLVLGSEDIGLQEAISELSLRGDRRPLLIPFAGSMNALPDEWFGYEAIDTVILTTSNPKMFEGLTSESPRIRALDRWLRLGGRLVFVAGKDSGPLLEGEKAPLVPFLPGRFNQMTEMRQGTPIELFSDSKRQIFMNGTDEAPYMKMPHFTEPRGITFLRDGDLPLILRAAHGFGTIVYFGGDLSAKPLASWRDRGALVKNIMQWNTEKELSSQKAVSLIRFGYTDMSGQIRSALDRFDGVRIIPFSVLLAVLVLYLLLIGPGDWLLVQFVLKRPLLTWFTFPLAIILFSAAALWLAVSGRPRDVLLNELVLVDHDFADKTVRGSVWGNLYSPGDARYSLRMNDPNALFSWNGLAGSGLGGMAPKTINPTVWRSGTEQEAAKPNQMENVPIQVRSTKSFFGQYFDLSATFPEPGPLADEEGVPVGEIVNTLKTPLENCIMVYGRWVHELGSLKPGERLKVGPQTSRRELRDVLIPRSSSTSTESRRLASYNLQSADLNYIARAMSLHGVVGGFETVGLHNEFQRSLDLSDLLSVDRVLLIGIAAEPDESLLAGEIDLPSQKIGVRKRTVLVRQSIPIRLTNLSPRLRMERQIFTKDALEDVDRTIKEKADPFKKKSN